MQIVLGWPAHAGRVRAAAIKLLKILRHLSLLSVNYHILCNIVCILTVISTMNT